MAEAPTDRDAVAEDWGGEPVPRVLHIAGAVVANSEPSQPLEPTDRAFDHPPDPSETAAVIDASASNDGLDALRSKALPDRLAVVATICIDRIGMLSGPAGLEDSPVNGTSVTVFRPMSDS